jgi:hypothetical protein
MLLPAENLALTVARSQLERGENPEINVTGMLVWALDRLAYGKDWREIAPGDWKDWDGLGQVLDGE